MRHVVTISIIAALLMTVPVAANPVRIWQQMDEIQDEWTIPQEVDELGNQPPFPTDEYIDSSYVTTNYVPCTSEYKGGVNFEVRITNNTGKRWTDLWYVADPETNLTNWDEWVGQIGFTPATKAFKIDAIGANTPLVFESMNLDGIFEAGETWKFVIQEYTNMMGLAASAFGSLGISAASVNNTTSSGSIVAIPEPATLVLLGLGVALLRRKR